MVNAREGAYSVPPLNAASRNGHEKTVQILLNAGAEVDARGYNDWTALQMASDTGYERNVQLLLKAGAEVDAQGDSTAETALQLASRAGHEKIVKILLEARADVNTRGIFYGTALQAAAWRGHEEIVRIPIDKGADVNARNRDDESDPDLQLPPRRVREQWVQILFLAEEKDKDQKLGTETALQLASREGHGKIVQLLLKAGAEGMT